MVVPMFAPMMTAMAPPNDNRPASAKPTTITVVADELCTAAVTAAPETMPFNGLSVILANTWRILLPANFCKPSLISFMAKRKMHNAPHMLMIISIIDQVSILICIAFSNCKSTLFCLSKLLLFCYIFLLHGPKYFFSTFLPYFKKYS